MKTDGNHTVDTVIIENSYEQFGLFKREYFAAVAMPHLVAARIKGLGYQDDPTYTGHGTKLVTSPALIATAAVRMADALIDALNEGVKR